MSEHNFEALYRHYPEIIAQMSGEFTSHQFILKLAQRYQQLYVEALYTYRHNKPFQIVLGILARELRQYKSLIVYTGEQSDSTDIFGHANSASCWKKIE